MTTLRRAWSAVRPALPDLRDLHVYGGGALVVYGIWQFYPPVAFMVGGMFLMYLGLKVPS